MEIHNDSNITEYKGKVRNNATVLGCYTAYNIILLACYLLEVLKKSRTIGYFAIFATLSLLPLILSHICYRLNKSGDAVRYVIAIGFPIFYIYTIFTTVSPIAFIYGLIAYVILMVYANTILSIVFGSTILLINIAHVVYLFAKDELNKADLPDIEIRLAAILVFVVFSVLVTRALVKNNEDKMADIAREKEHVSQMLSQIMSISDNMTQNISTVYEKMGVLENSVVRTKESMEEVSNGTNDTAESVQSQLMKTEEIQEYIQKVKNASGIIGQDMDEANAEVQLGMEKIELLIKQVEISEEASKMVSKEMDELTAYADNMQNIIELIDNITTQTSLLALNASIEAARVGEAGKGFAVVASEISNLAGQTQDATVEITELINNISKELVEVVTVVNQLMDNSKLQSDAATQSASSFETIAARIDGIRQQTQDMSGVVTELVYSNEAIMDSIQTISAATEEVTAHSNVTLECSEENSNIVTEVGDIVKELQALADRLNRIEQG